jgi:murein DD-endopeptidase MepM/ murein hydrolase activator NlpD
MPTKTASQVLSVGDKEPNGKGPIHGAQWLLAGHNVFKENYNPGTVDGDFGKQTGDACIRAKTALGYADEDLKATFGDKLRRLLLGEDALQADYERRRKERQASQAEQGAKFGYPANVKVKLIGRPGQGTHSWKAEPNNWQSDNAWDFAFPFGTPLVAVADGVIGNKIGPISSDPNSRFGGLRCYLKTADNEFYYAHLSKFAPETKAGAHVKQDQVIGFSGAASGVNHLHLGCVDWRAFEATAES